jgi:hypothetical protein
MLGGKGKIIHMMLVRGYFVAAWIAGVAVANLGAQEVIFQSSFDNDDGLLVLPLSDDSEFAFEYNYADFDTIPEAPNSGLLGGEVRTGLKLEANRSLQAFDSIAIATDDLGLSGPYSAQIDIWLNYNFPAGDAGTTEFGGLSVGHDGETGGVSGATFIYDTDGDSGTDYRLYKDSVFQAIAVDEEAEPDQKAIQLAIAGQYAVESLNNSDEPFVTAFPAIDIGDTVDQLIEGSTPAGSGGFRWMTLEAIVKPDAAGPAGITEDKGVATFTITEAITGEKIEIGTIDNSNGQGVVKLTGDVAVVFLDIFSSVSSEPDLSFGIFDNLIVSSLPEDVCDPNTQGDLDGNGKVEFADFLILSGNFGNAVDDHTQGDIDCNGKVEFADFLVLSGNFGESIAGVQAVPEPGGFTLVGLTGVAIASLRRRRSQTAE